MVNCSGADPFQRGNSPQKDVIQPAIHARLLQGHQVARLLDHAEQVPLAAAGRGRSRTPPLPPNCNNFGNTARFP